MSVATVRDLLGVAVSTKTAVAAFNVISIEHAEAIVRGAEQAGKPTILQLSQNAIAYHGSPTGIAAAMVAVAAESSVDVALHLDHITDLDLVRRTADLGFSSAMYDASVLPHAENVSTTRDAADWAHDHGLWLEAELGEIGGKDGAHAAGARTEPAEARDFVLATGVDAIAVAVGSSHAMTTQSASLDQDLIAAIAATVPVPLVLHGSSGVPDDALVAAAHGGMVKINIGTALNTSSATAVREWLDAHPTAVDPRGYLGAGRDAMAEVVAHYLRLLAS